MTESLTTTTPPPFTPNTEGIFEMPDAAYRAAPGVSQSSLKVMIEKSPLHFKWELEHPEPPTEAQIIGNLVDHAVLEPWKIKIGESHWIRPEGMSFRTNEGKAWRDEHSDLPIISEKDAANITGMIKGVAAHPIARRIIADGQSGMSMFCHHAWDDYKTLRKGRTDKMAKDRWGHHIIGDLKTTEDASPQAFSKSASKYFYHVQNAYYFDLYRDIIGEEPIFVFIVIEKNPPYDCVLYRLTDEDVHTGRIRYFEALKRHGECKESGIWPGYSQDIQRLKLSDFIIRPRDVIVPEIWM